MLGVDIVHLEKRAMRGPLREAIERRGSFVAARKPVNSPDRLSITREQLKNAITRLGEVVAMAPDSERLVIDSTIQRFEFSFELFWKYLERLLEQLGVALMYPPDVIKAACAGNLLEDEDQWISMMHDRNRTSHCYSQSQADEIYNRIKGYAQVMSATFRSL